jgi:hypothetical protein
MAMEEHERRRTLLTAALGFARLELRPSPPTLDTLKGWLGSWTGAGAVTAGMLRQGYDVDLSSLGPDHWQATFLAANPVGEAPVVAGDAEAPTPWAAVQRAAWKALNKTDSA